MAQRMIVRIPNWLGDAVMATAALKEFRRNQEDSITLLGQPNLLQVFSASPYRYSFLPYDRNREHAGWKGLWEIASRLRKEKFDRGYLLTNSFSSALLFRLGGVRERVGFRGHFRSGLLTHALPPLGITRHQAEKYAFLLTGNIPEPLQPEIFLTEEERSWAKEVLKQHKITNRTRIGFAFGAAYGSAKRWPPERYAETARRCITDLGAKVLLFGGEKEAEAAVGLVEQVGKGCLNFAGQTGLRELFALIERCRVLVCNDSGLMHVATALETPVIALFGPTDPIETGPLGTGNRIVSQDLDCAPCLKRECPLGHHACMELIQVNTIIEEIATLLKKNK